jgi:hypothetical protein
VHERERLQRFCGRAQEGDQARVTRLRDDLAVTDGDGMHPVEGLDCSAPAGGHADRLHQRPESPWSIGCMQPCGAPHVPQKRAPSRFSAGQLGQISTSAA